MSGELRASDDERRRTVELLEEATGRGLIDLDEFAARTDTALAARTRADLHAVLADLPGAVERLADPAPPAPGAAAQVVRTEDGWVSRRGPWTVPERLLVQVVLGVVELDLTATVVPPHLTLELDVTSGTVLVRVPEGARVDATGVEAVQSGVRVRTRPADVRGPDVVLRGRVHAGAVDVQGPRRPWFGRRSRA